MTELINVTISKPVFERLQKLATPLVDSTSAVIERLLDYGETRSIGSGTIANSNSTATQEFWKSSRGDTLPVGMELRGTYLSKTFTAKVERAGIQFEGKLYNNLSPAAIAAKNLAGTKGRAANTNGRYFWKFKDPSTGQWISVSVLRPSHRINAEELLAELESL